MIEHHPSQEPYSAEYWSNVIRPVFQDKKIIVAGETVAGALPRARALKALGAESTFILATEGTGTGDMPTKDDGHWFALDAPEASDIVETIQASQKLLGDLPPEAKAALDWYDPDHSAMVVGSFLHEQRSVAGRPSLAYRKPEWLALDDKTIIDSLWDKIGVSHEPSEVVAVDKDTILAASRNLDRGDGVVLSGDSRDGVGGGATGVRWLRPGADLDKSLVYFQKHCDEVRVMPFLEGIPCSIHGIVFPDYVAALRPVEMVVLRKPDSDEFFYAGAATYWDPKPEDREAMRTMAKRVGDNLRSMVDYRGIFTVDGVMTKDGFRPTELNPRSGAGIKPLTAGLDGLDLDFLAQTLVAGSDLDYKPAELEALIVKIADEKRGGGTWRALSAQLPPIENRHVRHTEKGWEWVDDGESDGTVSIGPGPLGSYVRLLPHASSVKVGSSFGPLAQEFWQFIDTNTGSNIGLLEPAKPVR
jgi:hypothetical protein